MEFNYLGKSGLRVSEICLGTMTWGYSTDKDEANKIFNLALENGVNFIDTADGYTTGASETILGDLLKDNRKDLVIATKFCNPMGSRVNDSGCSRIHIMKAVEDSLRRLKTDYIDLYYIHHTDNFTPPEETLRAMDDLVRQGKILYTACSNFEAWRLCDSLWISEVNKYSPFICYQGNYSLVVRDMEEDVIPLSKRKGIGLVAFGALAHGFLSGKYAPGQRRIEGTRSDSQWVFLDNMFSEKADDILQTLLDISEQTGNSPADIALQWVMRRPVVDSVLVGPRNSEQMQKNLQAIKCSIPDDAFDSLTNISAIKLRYPQNMEAGQQARRDSALKKW